MNDEKILLTDAKELIAHSAERLWPTLKKLSKEYKGIEETFFEEAYVPTRKRDQLLQMLIEQIESGEFDLLYFIAPFGFGKTFFVEHMKEVIEKLKFRKKYDIHVIPISMYAVTFNDLVIKITREIAKRTLGRDAVDVVNDYFYRNRSKLDGFPLELRSRAKSGKLTKKDFEKEIVGRLAINDIMDFITELLRWSFDEKETVCIFIIDELERVAQEEKERISSYRNFFSKLIRQSIEIPHWKLILSAPLEITEHESRHPLLDILAKDAADRLRDFDKDEYKLLFEVKEAVQFMRGMLNKIFEVICSRSESKDGNRWLVMLKKCNTFPIDPDLLEVLASTGLRQVGEQGLIQNFRSYIALTRFAIEVWLKHYGEFLEVEKPPINFDFFNEYSKEIQDRLRTSVEADLLGGINRAIFKYSIDEFLKKRVEEKRIAMFLLSLTERMKSEKKRKNAFDLTVESKKHHFKIDSLVTELKKIPEDLRNAFDLDIDNNVLRIDLDELGKLIVAEIPSIGPATTLDPFYKCLQEVRDTSLFNLLRDYLLEKGASFDEKQKTITIDNLSFGGRVILFSKDAPKRAVEKIKKSVEGYAGPIFALKIDESNPKWPNSLGFFVTPKWMKGEAEKILQFEKYRKWREKRVQQLASRFDDFKDKYNVNTQAELELLVLYKVPLWYRIHAKEGEPMPTPTFLDTGGLVLDQDFIKKYVDTEMVVDEFIKSILGLYLPKTKTTVSLLKFFIANFGKPLSDYDETLIRKNKHLLKDYSETFKHYTFKAGKFSTPWSKPHISLDEIRKELEKLGYLKNNIVEKNFHNFSSVSRLPEKTQKIIKTLIERLDKEDVTLPKLCEIVFNHKLKEEDGKVAWEDPRRLNTCILLSVFCMANLEITFEIKNKKIYINKNVLEAKRTKLANDIRKILAEELSWALFKKKEIDLSYLRKLDKQLQNAKKLKHIDEVAASIVSYKGNKLDNKEVEKKIEECRKLITNILTEKVNLSEKDRGKVQEFYVELRGWLDQMQREREYKLLTLLWHIQQKLLAVSNHLIYIGLAQRFNEKLDNSGGLLGAYKRFDEREERSLAITTAIEKISKKYSGAWFTKSDYPQRFEKKIEKIINQLLSEKIHSKEAIDSIIFIPSLVVSSTQIELEVKEIEKRDTELDTALDQYKSTLEKTIDEKENVLSRYEHVRKWQADISRLKGMLSQLRAGIEDYDLETEDLKELKENFDAKIKEINEELNEIIDLEKDEKELYKLVIDNDRSFVKILKSKGVTDYEKQMEDVIKLFIDLLKLRKKTGIEVGL